MGLNRFIGLKKKISIIYNLFLQVGGHGLRLKENEPSFTHNLWFGSTRSRTKLKLKFWVDFLNKLNTIYERDDNDNSNKIAIGIEMKSNIKIIIDNQ